MAFGGGGGGGGGGAYSGGGGVDVATWKKQTAGARQSNDEAQAAKWGYTQESAGNDAMLSRKVYEGPDPQIASMKSMMRTNDANEYQAQPQSFRTEWMRNPWYKAPEGPDGYDTTTTENPATGGSTTTVKPRLPQRQPSPRTQAGGAAAGSTSLLSASGDGLKTLLGQ